MTTNKQKYKRGRVVEIFDHEEIETMFKVEPPLTTVENGHGYFGVLLRDKDKDLIQCHICGKWCKSVGMHSNMKHATTAKEYRATFGLPIGFPLCNREQSKIRAENCTSWIMKNKEKQAEYIKTANATRKALRKTKRGKDNGKKASSYAFNSDAYRNSRGICDEQMKKRYLIACEMIGKETVSPRELKEIDYSLYNSIHKRFKGLTKFRREMGLIGGRVLKHSEESVLAAIRTKHLELGRIPRARDFRKGDMSTATMIRRFGSFRRALMTALAVDDMGAK